MRYYVLAHHSSELPCMTRHRAILSTLYYSLARSSRPLHNPSLSTLSFRTMSSTSIPKTIKAIRVSWARIHARHILTFRYLRLAVPK